jgi:hypothetical protein
VALEVRGQPIFSYGEFTELMRGLSEDGPSIEALAAWLNGEDVPPEDIHEALDIGCRVRARSDRARELIEMACNRLEELFPDEIGIG